MNKLSLSNLDYKTNQVINSNELSTQLPHYKNDASDMSYILGLAFMFSVIGLLIYANFHYDIQICMANGLIRMSSWRCCCILHVIFDFPVEKILDSNVTSKDYRVEML